MKVEDASWWATPVLDRTSVPARRPLLQPVCLSLQASSFPCVVIYVMDTSRSVNPVTFMSNMLYACRYAPYDRFIKVTPVVDVFVCQLEFSLFSLLQHSLQDQASFHCGHEQGELTSCLPVDL